MTPEILTKIYPLKESNYNLVYDMKHGTFYQEKHLK